jgi:phage-related minor tail protein
MYNERLGALSPKWDVTIKPLPSSFRDLCGRGRRKTLRTKGYTYTKETMASSHNRLGVHTKAHRGSTQKASQNQMVAQSCE